MRIMKRIFKRSLFDPFEILLNSLWVRISASIYNTTKNLTSFSIKAFLTSSRVWSHFHILPQKSSSQNDSFALYWSLLPSAWKFANTKLMSSRFLEVCELLKRVYALWASSSIYEEVIRNASSHREWSLSCSRISRSLHLFLCTNLSYFIESTLKFFPTY